MRTALLVLALIAAGCGWRRELAAGHAAAERDDWSAALAHYQAAAALRPDDKALQRRVFEARSKAVEALLTEARAAQAAGERDRAFGLCEQAEAAWPRQPGAALLREELVGDWAGEIRALLAAQDAEDPIAAAVEAWTAFARRFPVHPETARLGDEISAALTREVRALAARQDFAGGLARLDAFAERLPVDALQTELRSAWAGALRVQARSLAQRRQRAAAFAAQALAAGLSGSTEDKRERNLLRQAFLDAQAPVLGPRLAGERGAVTRLGERIESLLQPTPALRWKPSSPRPTVGGRIEIRDPRWEQVSKATVAVHEIPGPAREHENPAWQEADGEARQAAEELRQAEVREAEAVSTRGAEQRRLEELRQGQAGLEEALAEVTAARDAAEAEALRARAALDESIGAQESVRQTEAQRAALEAALAQAQASLDQSLAALAQAGSEGAAAAAAAVDACRREVEERRAALEAAPKPANLARELARHVEDRAGTLAEKERLAEQARATLADRRAPLQDQLDAVARAEARLAELDAAAQAARAAQAEARRAQEAAEARRAALPATVFGPVLERREVPVQDWLRACALELDIALLLPGGERFERKLVARAETRDEERPAVPDLGLEADPLAFPETDLQLLARAEADLFRRGLEGVGELRALLAAAQLAQANAAKDPDARLPALLLAWLMLPPPAAAAGAGSLPEVALEGAEAPRDAGSQLAALLQERWGLGDPRWLLPATGP